MASMKKNPCKDGKYTGSTGIEFPPNPFSARVDDLPLDPKILVGVIEFLTKEAESLNKAIDELERQNAEQARENNELEAIAAPWSNKSKRECRQSPTTAPTAICRQPLPISRTALANSLRNRS